MKIALVFFLVLFTYTNSHSAPPFNEEILGGLRFIKRSAGSLDKRIKDDLKTKDNPENKKGPLFSDSLAAIFIALHATYKTDDTEKKLAEIENDPSEAVRDYQYFLKNADYFKSYIASNVERINKASNQQERNNAVFGEESINDLTRLMVRASVTYKENSTPFSGQIEMLPSGGGSTEEGKLFNFVLRLDPESTQKVTEAAREAIETNPEIKELGLEISTATGTENKQKRQITLGLREKCTSEEEVKKCIDELNNELSKSNFIFHTQGELKFVVPNDIRYEQLATSVPDQESISILHFLHSKLSKLVEGGNKIAPFGITQAVKNIKTDEKTFEEFLENSTHKDAINNFLNEIEFPTALEETTEEVN